MAKIESLDSVRGLAALIVVFWHFASAFYPAIAGGPAGVTHTRYDILVFRSPLSIIFAGNFAVVVFFVLSGFVLTIKFHLGQQKSLFAAAVKRYVRLMPIVLVSILFSYAILTLGLMYFKPAGTLSGSPWLSTGYFQFQPSLLDAISQGLLIVFVTPLSTNQAYNPLLWTIYYELLGSLLVFGLVSLGSGHSKRWMLYLIASVGLINTYFCGFIIGAALADLYANKHAIYDRIQYVSRVYRWALLVVALAICAYPVAGDLGTNGKYWSMLTLFDSNLVTSRSIMELIAATIIIFLALSWLQLKNLLEKKPLLWLGKISYSLYATHFMLLFSLSSRLMIALVHYFSYNLAAMLTGVISLPIMLGLAYLLHKYIEIPSIAIANQVGDWAKS